MLFRVDWEIDGINRNEIFARFVDSASNPDFDLPEGVIMLGRWHEIASLRGTSIWEADDVGKLMHWLQHWNDLANFELTPVVGDEEAGKICADTLAKLK